MSTTGYISPIIPNIQTIATGQTITNVEVNAGVGIRTKRGRIVFRVLDNTTGVAWSCEFEGYPQTQANNQVFNYEAYPNTTNNVDSITKTTTNQFTVVTAAADSGGRTYTLQFFPFGDTDTTIQRTAGVDFVSDGVVQIFYNMLVRN